MKSQWIIWQAGKQASRQAGKQASRQAGKQASRQAGKQASRQASNTIDVLKLFFSVCVVGLHTKPLIRLPEMVQWYVIHLVFRLAVPFFFCVSGYFLGKKLCTADEANAVFKRYIQRMIPPFLAWGTIGLLQYIIQLYIEGAGITEIAIKAIRTAIFYPKGAMWYVGACIVAALIIQFFWQKKHRDTVIWLIGIGGYLFALTANSYYFLTDGTYWQSIVDVYLEKCISARNGIFVGLIFIWLGIMLARVMKKTELKDGIMVAAGILFLAYMVYMGEVYLVHHRTYVDDSAFFFSLPLLVPAGVYLALKSELNIAIPGIELRKLSTCIYFTHSCFNEILAIWIPKGFVRFVCVLAICLLTFYLNKRYPVKWLQKIL